LKFNKEFTMLPRSLIVLVVACSLLLAACQPAVVETPVQEEPTVTAVPPTDTPVPLPTETPVPSETPLPTATPGPIVVKDDFSSQSDVWGKCEHCEWKDGALYFGPYEPSLSGGEGDQLFYLVCEACGVRTYYRVSADVTFLDGYGDRTFGVLAGLSEDEKWIGAGTVSTLQHGMYEAFDFGSNQWVQGTFKKFTAVHPGRGTNRIEVTIEPDSAQGMAKITVSVNGETLVSLANQYMPSTWAGLYLGWHTVGAIYDNFEYEEIPVK
jgi:hypothetical protein